MIDQHIDTVNLFNKNLRKFYNNYKKLGVIFDLKETTMVTAYITEIKSKKIKIYIPQLDIEHGFYPVSPKLIHCNTITESDDTLSVNDMEFKLYGKIYVHITPMPFETKFNRKLFITIDGLRILNDI